MQSELPNVPYLGRYIVCLLGGIVLMAVVNVVLRSVLDLGSASGASTVIPPMLAAMLVGRKWAEDTGKLPDTGHVWRLSLMGAAFYGVLQLLLGLVVLFSVASLDGLGFGILLALVAFVGGITILVNRWFIGMGAKNHLKHVERQ